MNGLSRGELFLGYCKMTYLQDGTWHGNTGVFNMLTKISHWGGRAASDTVQTQDITHPRMRIGKQDWGFQQDGNQKYKMQDCGVQAKRFFICALDLPAGAAR